MQSPTPPPDNFDTDPFITLDGYRVERGSMTEEEISTRAKELIEDRRRQLRLIVEEQVYAGELTPKERDEVLAMHREIVGFQGVTSDEKVQKDGAAQASNKGKVEEKTDPKEAAKKKAATEAVETTVAFIEERLNAYGFPGHLQDAELIMEQLQPFHEPFQSPYNGSMLRETVLIRKQLKPNFKPKASVPMLTPLYRKMLNFDAPSNLSLVERAVVFGMRDAMAQLKLSATAFVEKLIPLGGISFIITSLQAKYAALDAKRRGGLSEDLRD